MNKVNFENAYFLKLGKKGEWETDLEKGEKARIGWTNVDIRDLKKRDWNKIKQVIEQDFKERGKKSGATQDFNALRAFCEATENDIFITFNGNRLYWCFLNGNIEDDGSSKYRNTKIKWSCQNVKGKIIHSNEISGKISKTQGFRATLCKIEEKDTLLRIINGENSTIAEDLLLKKKELSQSLINALSMLNWKDCEILTDLIFRQSGWRRISLLGEKMKEIDMQLEDPITNDKYNVQVKAQATINDFKEFAESSSGLDLKKSFFVTFEKDFHLNGYECDNSNVQLLTGEPLASLIVDLGLTQWVIDKLR